MADLSAAAGLEKTRQILELVERLATLDPQALLRVSFFIAGRQKAVRHYLERMRSAGTPEADPFPVRYRAIGDACDTTRRLLELLADGRSSTPPVGEKHRPA